MDKKFQVKDWACQTGLNKQAHFFKRHILNITTQKDKVEDGKNIPRNTSIHIKENWYSLLIAEKVEFKAKIISIDKRNIT